MVVTIMRERKGRGSGHNVGAPNYLCRGWFMVELLQSCNRIRIRKGNGAPFCKKELTFIHMGPDAPFQSSKVHIINT